MWQTIESKAVRTFIGNFEVKNASRNKYARKYLREDIFLIEKYKCNICVFNEINSLRPSAAYMRR